MCAVVGGVGLLWGVLHCPGFELLLRDPFGGGFGWLRWWVFFFCLVVAFGGVVLYFLGWWQYRHRIGKGHTSANY